MSDELRLAMAALRSADRENVGLRTRVELLTAALTEIAANRCEDRHDWCSKEETPREDWCNPCIARAALAAEEKSDG